ncbi:hypothetical protein MMC07_000404 [Pseudocyphellaria aurata]|nr:hypothetical protein [Pseudocyphellaria aurata]
MLTALCGLADLDHEDFRAGLVSHAPPAKRRRDSSPQRYSDAQHDAQARGGWERQTEPQRDSQPVHFDARDMAQEAVAGAAQAHRQADQDRELLMSDMAAANRPRTPARDGLSKDAQHAQPAAA